MVIFGWGTNIVMPQAYIKHMSVTYKRFLLGNPVRAEVTVSLESVPSDTPYTNPTSGGIATRRTHTVTEGDTLASISYQEYGDPTRWRALAEVNQIDDPMRLAVGTVLLVPDPREAKAWREGAAAMSVTDTTSCQCDIEVMGAPLDPVVLAYLVSAEVDSSLFVPSQFRLVFRAAPDDVLDPGACSWRPSDLKREFWWHPTPSSAPRSPPSKSTTHRTEPSRSCGAWTSPTGSCAEPRQWPTPR